MCRFHWNPQKYLQKKCGFLCEIHRRSLDLNEIRNRLENFLVKSTREVWISRWMKSTMKSSEIHSKIRGFQWNPQFLLRFQQGNVAITKEHLPRRVAPYISDTVSSFESGTMWIPSLSLGTSMESRNWPVLLVHDMLEILLTKLCKEIVSFLRNKYYVLFSPAFKRYYVLQWSK